MSLRHVLAVALGAAAIAPVAVAVDPRVDAAKLTRSTMGTLPSADATLLVTFRDRPTIVQARRRLGSLGRVSQSVPEIGVWALRPTNTATARAAAERRPGVIRAEWSLLRTQDAFPFRRRRPIEAQPLPSLPAPADPQYEKGIAGQWSMHRNSWSASLTGLSPRPIIAILDSGLDTTQVEWSAPGVVVKPWSTIRRSSNAQDWSVTGHGTHVAGIAAAPMDGQGVVGVAPVDTGITGARIMPVQIATARGLSSDATIMAGIKHAVNNGARVINISSGGPGYSQAFQDTINWAHRRGATVIASVGNEGDFDNPLNFPAGYDHVIGVAAQCDAASEPFYCPNSYGRARFSNVNYSVDLIAPGVNIVSTLRNGIVDSSESNGYGRKTGTSMAAPFVAGAAALIYASHPGIRPHQVARVLATSSSRGIRGWNRNNAVGWGLIDVEKAVTRTAPLNDTAEPNDDVNWVPRRYNIPLPNSKRSRNFTAWADYYDDPMDVYAIPLYRGKLVRVTISSRTARLRAYAFHGKGRISPRLMTPAQFNRRFEGATRRATPRARSFVFRARSTGRHYIQVLAFGGQGNYRIRFDRLN